MNKKLLLSYFFVVSSYAAQPTLPAGIFSSANGYPQEDRAVATFIDNNIFLGVYDGHGGSDTVSFLSADLHNQFALYIRSLSVQEAFETTINEVDSIARRNCLDGSTAAAVYIKDNCAHVINIGDSRVIIEKNGCVDFATEDHNFQNPKEKARVLQKQGVVFRSISRQKRVCIKNNGWRVNNLLPLRTIGDKWQKGDIDASITLNRKEFNGDIIGYQVYEDTVDETEYKISETLEILPKEGQIIADPEYTQWPLTQENRWLILATDGLTDFVSNDETVNIVVQQAAKGMLSDAIAQFLVEEAIRRGSKDNITVILHDLLQQKKR